MDFAKLRHILAVAKAGNISRAAEELHLTQPALSRSIASFEAQHGLRLFDRERSGVVLTASGRLVVEQARAIVSATGDLDRNLRLYSQGEAGRVEVGLGPLLASLLLPRLGRTLLGSRPHLQLFTLVKPADQLLIQLMNDEIEMVFGNSWHVGQLSNLVNEPVGRLKLAMVVRADHVLVGRADLTLRDLAVFPAATAVELPAAGLGASCGAFICDNFHILRDMVLGTDCVWLTAPAFVAPELRDGRLIALDVADLKTPETEICMVRRRGRVQSSLAALVRDEVRGFLANVDGLTNSPNLAAVRWNGAAP